MNPFTPGRPEPLIDRAFAWMASNPWRVTALILVAAFFVGAMENPLIDGGLVP